MEATVWCGPGEHAGPEVRGGDLPSGWRFVRCRYRAGRLVFDPGSAFQVCACPEHAADGEEATWMRCK